MSYSTPPIRELLQTVFSDEQLTIFCFDYFRPVYEQFASGMGRLVKIQLLIEYCDKFEEFDKLLALVKAINSKQYDKFSPLIKNLLKTPMVDIGTSRGQMETTFSGDYSDFPPELRSAAAGAAVGAIAGVLNIPPDQISVLHIQIGSLILQIEMPAEAVERMIALYEAGDPIIQDLGIEQVKKIFYEIPSQTTAPISSRIHGKSQRALKTRNYFVQEYDLSELILLKLGGSVITDKTKPFTARMDVIERLAVEIKNALDERGDDLQLIIGHGAGSFGHEVAAKYQTHKGAIAVDSWTGFAEVAAAAAELNHIIMKVLRQVGIPAIKFQPSASTRTRGEQLMYFETFPVKEVIKHGLVPVIYGDVSVDASQGMSIVSTEKLFDSLARELAPSRIVLAGHVDGVYQQDPLIHPDAEFIEDIDRTNWEEIEAMLSGSHGTDVTGGMFTKVREIYRLTLAMPPMQAMIMSAEEPGHLEAVLKGQMVSFGTLIN